MGEVEKTLERLNKVLVENGFSKADMGSMARGELCWHTDWRVPLRFDKNGKYIVPENGEY